MIHATLDTPLGPLHATLTPGGTLRRLRFADEEAALPPRGETAEALAEQMQAYFRGGRQEFDVAVDLEGSSFEQRVWKALQAVPFGATVSYGALAARLGAPGAAQAVGRACAANPALIVVPCHRVVGAGGVLTGYAGGAERKAALLRHEGALLV